MGQISRSTFVPAAFLAGLCPLAANSVYEDDAGSGAQILAAAGAGQPVAAMISNVLFLVGFVALIVVLGVLAAAIARSSPALAGIVAVAGAASVAIKLSEAQTGMALRETAGVLDPGTAEALVAIDEAGFAVYGVLPLLAQGRSNTDIAAVLFISAKTARNHVSSILGNLAPPPEPRRSPARGTPASAPSRQRRRTRPDISGLAPNPCAI